MADGVRQQAFHGLDLAQAGGVEMTDAGIPKIAQRDGMGIGLHGIEYVAGKTV